MTQQQERYSPPWPGTTEVVRREVAQLAGQGWDVAFTSTDFTGHFLLPDDRQRHVTQQIDSISRNPDFAHQLLNAETNPAGAAWYGIAKRAVALHAFYNIGTMDGPSDGIDPGILDAPLFKKDKKEYSARELTYAEYDQQKAAHILGKYDRFFSAGSLWQQLEGYGVSSGELIAGSVDRLADVARANIAIAMFDEHLKTDREYRHRGIVSASLGCGAAEPVYWLAKALEQDDIPVERIILVDADPIALAASTSRAKVHGLAEKITLHRKNILKTPIESYIDPQSVDVIDLIGLFEYLPEHPKSRYRMAGNLLADVAKVVRPGGMIVFGNMLNSRPQQKWFEGIWPKLEQRSVQEVLDIMTGAGFAKEQVSVRIAEGEGLYALYGIHIPKDGHIPKVSPTQRAIGRIITSRMPEY